MNNRKYKYVPQKGAPTKAQNPDTQTPQQSPRNGTSEKKPKPDYENPRASPPFPVLEPDLFYAPPALMSDAEVAAFIVNGFHVINTGLPDEFHDALYTYANGKEISRFTNNPGNNILPVIPSLEYIFECPPVRGALQSILGKDYMMHPHRHPHCNAPGFKGQQFHKDSFFGYELGRHHYPMWVMAMYYPQDTPVVLGPTGISPTTQYSSLQDTKKRHLDVTKIWGTKDVPLECKKGTVVLIHYDLWHKGTPNLGTINRFMFKFQFMRMTPPMSPSWQNTSPDFPLKESHILAPLHLQVWKWMRGDTTAANIKTTSEERKKLFAMLRDTSAEGEPARLHAAYTLAHDTEIVDGLFELVYSEHQCVRRSVLYGLSSTQNAKVAESLTEILVGRSLFPYKNELTLALSDMGANALCALPALLNLLSDKNEFVSSATAEAIGLVLYFLDQSDKSGSFLAQAKWQEDFYKVVQPAFRSSNDVLRFNICLSIARIGNLEVAARFVKELERCATMDQNRYVRAYALEALQRMNSVEGNKIALRILKSSHYCAVTTFDSTF
eukprot:Phypoly_transcript_06641.p1 GENE.Phypoly_transcript_06641~~Phypoly_transcript_06641.p1  ORF type:complete len:553 (+),score=72.23 Phypoly_transcript_06641:62-1720(+)